MTVDEGGGDSGEGKNSFPLDPAQRIDIDKADGESKGCKRFMKKIPDGGNSCTLRQTGFQSAATFLSNFNSCGSSQQMTEKKRKRGST